MGMAKTLMSVLAVCSAMMLISFSNLSLKPGMIVDPGDISAEESYKLLTGIVVPRPIAWVTTLNAQGGVNLAPFSAFTRATHTS